MPVIRKYLVALKDESSPYIVMAKYDAVTDSLDTTWGTAGYFSYTDPVTGQSITEVRAIAELSDGRFLIGINDIHLDVWPLDPANTYTASAVMLNADGSIDTTWGHNGFFAVPYNQWYMHMVMKILADAAGNVYLFGYTEPSPPIGSAYYSAVKLNSDGDIVAVALRAPNDPDLQTGLWTFHDAVWADAGKTKILGMGLTASAAPYGFGYKANYSMMLAADLSRDLTWPGNVAGSGGGIANFPGPGSTVSFNYALQRVADGGYVCECSTASKFYFKILADGSGLDTAWAVNGILDIASVSTDPSSRIMTYHADHIYTIAYRSGPPITCWGCKIDAAGTVVLEVSLPLTGTLAYHALNIFLSKIYFGIYDGDRKVELRDLDFNYISQFNIADTTQGEYVFPILSGGGPRQIILGKRRTGQPIQAGHTANRNVFG